MVRLTSLLLVEERLLEADYFVGRLRRSEPDSLSANLNAFLSAARSTTFLLQKEMADVPGFDVWWAERQEELRQDAAARFFVRLRNFSQKEGRVPTIGFRSNARRGRWSYRFSGKADPTPPELYDRDIAECCSEHVAKLARLSLRFAEAFPFYSCPHRTLTSEGVAALGLSLTELTRSADLPDDWFDVDTGELETQLAGVRALVDEVDFTTIGRLARPRRRPRSDIATSDPTSGLLLENLPAGPEGYAVIAAHLLLQGHQGPDKES